MNEQQMIAKIKQLEPDFNPVEEAIVEFFTLNLTARQWLAWGDAKFKRLCSLSPTYITEARMKAMHREAHRRNLETRNES